MSYAAPQPLPHGRRRPLLLPLLVAMGATLGALALPGGGNLASAASGSVYADAVRADAPAGYWRLGEPSGTRAADDLAANPGRYRNGAKTGRSSLVASDAGNPSVSFDGVDDDVLIGSTSALSPSAALSIEAWIRPAALPVAGAWASVVTKAESYSLQFNGPRLEFTIIQAGSRRRLDAPAGVILAGSTYHVVATYDGATQRLYVNGAQVASASLAGGATVTTRRLTFGSWDGTGQRFTGTLDDVALYRKALSATRVAAHWAAGHTVAPTATRGPTVAPTATLVPTVAPTATPVPTVAPTATPVPTVAPTATPMPTVAPTATPTLLRTGIAAHFMWQPLADTTADLDLMRAAGMTYVRFDLSWRNSEPVQGTYQYLDKLDQVIAAVKAHGMALTITVIETPSWANGGKGMFAPPTTMADYASFVGMVAGRYAATSGMVWEIWNEENDPNFWTTGPSAAGYTSMLKAAYPAIKAADPDATVITGGILYNDTAFLEGIYAAGGGAAFDGLGIHPYCLGHAPGSTADPYFSFAGSVPQFTQSMAAHGQGSKPIWITEMGWSTSVVSDATRATYLRDAVTIARGWTNVRGMGAYTLHQSQFPTYGLFTTAGTPTLSWTAYAAAR